MGLDSEGGKHEPDNKRPRRQWPRLTGPWGDDSGNPIVIQLVDRVEQAEEEQHEPMELEQEQRDVQLLGSPCSPAISLSSPSDHIAGEFGFKITSRNGLMSLEGAACELLLSPSLKVG